MLIAMSAALAQPVPSPEPQPLPILTAPPPYTPPPTPTPTATATPLPGASPSIAPSPAPTPAPSATAPPTGAPTNPYNFVYTPAPNSVVTAGNAPAILEIDMTDQIIHAPGTFNIRVVTTLAVSDVTLRVPDFGRSFPLPKIGDAQFGISLQLPSVPAFVHGKHNVEFIASVPDGRTSLVTIPLSVER
jgi:hypothetical protein